MVFHERILKTLAEESHWLTFDELYDRVRPDYDWIEFAELLEELVEQGSILARSCPPSRFLSE